MGRVLDLAEERFGKLTATNTLRKIDHRVARRLCYCDCGNITWVPTDRLRNGHTKSCGCWQVEFRKLEPGRAVRNQILDCYQRDAKKRKLIWRLSGKQFDHLVMGRCYYCHRLPNTTRKARRHNGDFTYNGIDRLNNARGYTTTNVVTCCPTCNRAKSDMGLEDFLSWVKDLSEAYNEG